MPPATSRRSTPWASMPTARADPFDDPKVETITSLVKRRLGMAVGIVTNTEIEDATPAAMVAHTRRRATYDEIVEQFFAAKPDVLMGGGSANFLPKSGRRTPAHDETDYIAKIPRRRLCGGADGGRVDAPAAKAEQAARPVPHRQHGWRAGSQVPQGRHGRRNFPTSPTSPNRCAPRSTCYRANRAASS